ncbi:hypothetical protein [Paracerasibacillus soli]|uniref:Uncharacterized protein n=1 Tax=Paracerasibacillus soli TaxID=480284 RepID=A0ABU5CPZ7_9BACI|nr:hypothetical protein [Virgibacillus soli]MDY0408421.1 hypothetical protein [Virgibacillus soli]
MEWGKRWRTASKPYLSLSNDMTNAKAYGDQVVATNPCGEQVRKVA